MADLTHAHKSGMEPHFWGSGCGLPNPGTTQLFFLLRPSVVSSVCAVVIFKDQWYCFGGGMGSQCKDCNHIHSWMAQCLHVCRLLVRWMNTLAVIPAAS